MTHHFQEIDGKPYRIDPAGIGLGCRGRREKDGSGRSSCL